MDITSILSFFGIKCSSPSTIQAADNKCTCTPTKPLKTYKRVCDNSEYTIKGKKVFGLWKQHGYSQYGLEIFILSDSGRYVLYTEKYDDGTIKIFDELDDLKRQCKWIVEGNGLLDCMPEYFRGYYKVALEKSGF